MSFGGGSSGGSTTSEVTPYSAAEPQLGQILSEAGTIYGQGPQYVAPTQQQLEGHIYFFSLLCFSNNTWLLE